MMRAPRSELTRSPSKVGCRYDGPMRASARAMPGRRGARIQHDPRRWAPTRRAVSTPPARPRGRGRRPRAANGEPSPIPRRLAASPADHGKTGQPVTMHIERGKIREFARAIKDDDPLYFDEDYAAKEA